jgi:hypothetical protein
MPTNTYTALATITLTGTDSSIDFASIPGTYRDLVIVIRAKNTVDAQGIRAQFNSDTGNNYSYVVMYGTGSSAASGASASQGYADFGVNRTTDTSTIVQIMDYSATDKHKTMLVRSDNASEITLAYANRWASTSAITAIKLYASVNSFAIGSTFSLYGIAS